ncbi:mutator 2 [Haematobia irritans]|uniref:mutator 2 n=1 Tax=Haematobia irritans TaxID=7368 RepID=UPI003F50A7F8
MENINVSANGSQMFVEISGHRRGLEAGLIYLFGRHLPKGNYNIFNIENEDVDEKHCAVEVTGSGDVYVFDLFSSHGTFLNGERLKAMRKMCVKSGDEMKLGLTCIRFYHEQLELSHDSSGFGDHNKNTSDIFISSPETTSQRETRVKRRNSNTANNKNGNFLIPTLPPPSRPSLTSRASSSFTVPETEDLSTSRRSLLNNSHNKKGPSDSFIIPETQYCGGRASLASNLSIAESIPDENKTKSGINFNISTEDGDDDFCIPETQDVIMNDGKRPQPNIVKGLKPLEEKSVDLNDSDDGDDDAASGSQIRICTQDYNDGFGEEEQSISMQSQVIPLIRHSTVLLNGSCVNLPSSQKEGSLNTTAPPLLDDNDKEVAKINWFANKTTNSNNQENDLNCTTPDLFDCQAFDNPQVAAPTDLLENNAMADNLDILENDAPIALEDEEDYVATQLFPASNSNAKKPNNKGKLPKEKNIFEGKDDENFLTLSDKENMQPGRIEPIGEMPPTQLFASNETSSRHSSTSTSSRTSSQHKKEDQRNESTVVLDVPATTNNIHEEINNLPISDVMADEEDDILTQAFVPPPPKSAKATTKSLTNNYFNSTLLEDRTGDKNPASFFAAMERTPKKDNFSSFKMPERTFSAVRKTTSSASTTSTDSDMDLLMCTPQLIKDHMQFSKADDLKKHILAVKNKKLFGEDTDDDGDFEESESVSKDNCLVQLLNMPKDSKDFDRLLPHLKYDNNTRLDRKPKLTNDQKAAKDACKEYKFNISFGNDQTNNNVEKSSKSSSTLSRDERHALRDREYEKRKIVNEETQKSLRKQKSEQSKSSIKEEPKEKEKEEKPTKRGRPPKRKKTEKSQDLEKDSKEEKIVQQKLKEKEEKPAQKKQKEKEEKIVLQKEKEETSVKSTRSSTRLKSINKDADVAETDTDSISTQQYTSTTGTRARSVQKEAPVKKPERKRKSELPDQPQHHTIERKRAKRTISQDSSNSSYSSSIPSRPLISITMVEPERFNELSAKSKGQWAVAKDPKDSHILVMDKAFRTFKFLLAVARGIPIVTSQWLDEINNTKTGKCIPSVDKFLFKDPVFEKKHKFSIEESLKQRQQDKKGILHGCEFIMTSNIKPSPTEIQAIIELSGGIVHLKNPPPPKKNQKIYLVSSTDDCKEWHKFRRINSNISIVATEAVMSTVMRQNTTPLINHVLA